MNQKEQIREYYDKYADVYDTKHGVTLYGQAYNFGSYYEPFLKEVIPQTGKVLELGCGTGVYTKWLVSRGLTVVGMDISSEMLKQAERRCPNASFYEGDCENPAAVLNADVIGEGFDAVVGVNTFSYYLHKETALRNYRDLLRANGRFIIIDMNGSCPFYKWMAWLNTNEMREWLAQVKESNRNYLTSLLERANFRVDRLEHFAFIPNGLSKRSVALLKPFDQIMGLVPWLRNFSMRIALAATKR